ncbi:MAG: class I tRNA ligase family protein, partial [Patescibacteria group bacterium]
DFETGKKHNLEIREVIDQYGRLNEKTGPYQGLKVMEARKKVAEDMEKNGLLEKIDENYTHTIATCYKCGSTIEPRIMKQWFVKIKPLAELAQKAVKNNEVKFITKKYEKIFFHWMKNIRDWNISRQIIWGIPIPVKYCDECSDVVVDINDVIEKCPRCKNEKLGKEQDTFDTWFSSGQWPFAALKANKPEDFEDFYPTTVMETGWDILFFWVARMLMLGIYAAGKSPFKYVYLNGLVRDKDRQKMSKSKGNVIDPLGVVELYGADALRMALIVGNTPGSDIIISEEKIRGYRKFANKIWNVARFVLLAIQNEPSADLSAEGLPKAEALTKTDYNKKNLTKQDKKTLKELENLNEEITKLMDSFKFYSAAEKIYHYFWHTFADKIIEEAKPRLSGKNEKDKQAAQYVLKEVLETNLKLLHPFMPFLTEKIWQELGNKDLLIIEKWPR